MPSHIAPVGLTRSYAVRPAAGLRFGNFEGVVHLPPVKNVGTLGPHSFSTLNNQHIYRTVCEWVESWQPWQQKVILYSIVNRCSQQQLKILATTLEPLRHRDYMTISHRHYSSASLHSLSSSKESTELKSALKKVPKIVSPPDKSLKSDNIDKSLKSDSIDNLRDSGEAQPSAGDVMAIASTVTPRGDVKEEPEVIADKDQVGMTLDQYASLVTSALLVAALGEISLADKIERKTLKDDQEKAEDNEGCQEPLSARLNVDGDKMNSKIETDPQSVPVTPKGHASSSRIATASVRDGSALPGILCSAAEKRLRSQEEGRASAQFLGGRISFTPQSCQSRRSEGQQSGSSRYRHSTFGSSAASTTDFFLRDRVATLGPMQREIRTGPVQRPVGLGDIPVSLQHMYKHRGWWADAPHPGMKFLPAKKSELANNFRDQQATILGWMYEWEGHERLALLKEVAKVCGPAVLETLVAYIHQKLRDACDINRLPDKLLMYIMSFLSPSDIRTCAQVCRRWRYLCAMDDVWIVKCLKLGEEEGLENVPELIASTNTQQRGIDWMLAYMELHALVTSIKQAEDRLRQEAEAQAMRETESTSGADADGSGLMKRFRIRRRFKGDRSSSSQTDSMISVTDADLPKTTSHQIGGRSVSKDAEVDSAFSEEDLTPFMQDGDKLHPQPKPSSKYPGWGKTQRKTLRSSVKPKIQETLPEHSSRGPSGAASRVLGSSKARGSRQRSGKEGVTQEQEEDTALDIHTDLSHSKDLLGKVVPAMSLEWETPAHDEDFIRYPVYAGKVRTIQRVRKVQGHIGGILCLQFDQRRLVTGGADHAVRLWDVRSGRSVHKFYGHKGGVRCLKFDNDILVTGSWDSVVIVWSMRLFTREAVLHGHDNSVSCLHLSRHFIMSGSHDSTVRVWSRPIYINTLVLRGHAGPILSLVADTRHVFSTATDLTVRMTDLLTGQCVRVLERANKSPILTLTMHGALLLGGDSEGRVYFWNAKSGEAEAAIQVHDAAIHTVTYHNSRFYTASSDGTMTEYDLMTMTCLRVLRGHKGPVRAMQVSDRRFVSCSDDGTARIWDLATDKTTSLSSVF